jgi:3-phytase
MIRSAGAAALIFSLCGCSHPLTTEEKIARSAPAAVVRAAAETVPVQSLRADAADDPAIWRDPADPSASLIVGTDKKAGLYVYGLDGRVRDFHDAGLVNNVDLKSDIVLGGSRAVLVAASDRNDLRQARIALFRLEPGTGKLAALGTVAAGKGEAYGLCLSRQGGGLYAFVVLKDGTIHQVRLTFDAGAPAGEIVRTMKLGTQSEGCAVDDRTGRLYVAEERVGLWRFDSRPDGSATPVKIAAADGRNLVADAEGVALAPSGERGGYLIVSSQGDNAYALYRLEDESYAGRFRIAAGGVGATEETDGIELALGDFGPSFPGGLFVAQDGMNAPAAQNFKLVAWAEIVAALGLEP